MTSWIFSDIQCSIQPCDCQHTLYVTSNDMIYADIGNIKFVLKGSGEFTFQHCRLSLAVHIIIRSFIYYTSVLLHM